MLRSLILRRLTVRPSRLRVETHRTRSAAAAVEPLERRACLSTAAFAPAPSPAAGDQPSSVAVGDFNRDGKPDMAATSFGSNTVTVLLGKGDGTFSPATSPATGSGPFSVAVGDFNRDGRPDLAAANFDSHTLTVLLGKGDGTFSPATASPATGDNPNSVAVGDFNRDGRPDLAATNAGSDTVTVLLGKGDGTFAPAPSPATGGYPSSVAVGDFNRDGKPDLAAASYNSSTVTVLLGKGDGTFAPTPSLATGEQPASVALGDFNRDGRPDLATANTRSGTVTVLLNTTPPPPPPVPSLRVADAAADEGDAGARPLRFAVRLSAASAVPVTVKYATGNETARAPGDYAKRFGTLTFAPGETAKTVNVPVNGDAAVEADERFKFVLYSPSGATVAKALAFGTIRNDDRYPAVNPGIAVGDARTVEGDGGTHAVTFTVTLDRPTGKTVGVRYGTADGTATVADHDYRAASGTLTFRPGERTKTVSVVIIGDPHPGGDEQFRLILSSPINGTLARAVGVGTILTDDPPRTR
jgi:hypothetical protein